MTRRRTRPETPARASPAASSPASLATAGVRRDMVARASAVKVRLTFMMVTLIVGATRQATPETPPIPAAGPLARPKSLQQVGTPADTTRAAFFFNNPQTPEKIALGQR